MILKNFLRAFFLALLFMPTFAHATKTVTSPYVKKGQLSAEWRGGYEIAEDGDNEFAFRNQLFYGFTDWYEAKLSLDGSNSGDTELTDMDLENKFQLTPKGEYWIDMGLRLDYVKNLRDGPDEVGGKILFGKETGKVRQLANLEAGREIGEDYDPSWAYGLSYLAAYELSDNFEIGGEYYADFGTFEDDFAEQEHLLGPVAYGSVLGLRYQFGVLAGLTDSSPDALVKSTIRYDF